MEIRLKNPYKVMPEQTVTLLWHDIVLAKEKKKAHVKCSLISIAFFATGFAFGLIAGLLML